MTFYLVFCNHILEKAEMFMLAMFELSRWPIHDFSFHVTLKFQLHMFCFVGMVAIREVVIWDTHSKVRDMVIKDMVEIREVTKETVTKGTITRVTVTRVVVTKEVAIITTTTEEEGYV